MSTPLISVVIPVKNGAATLCATLIGIFSQTLRERIEVIIIDSGSSDSTLTLAANFPAKIHQISPQEFNHGTTRNLGVSMALGEFVVMTVQDATPVDAQWLEHMLMHFDDPQVAGVCGRQMTPHDSDKNPMQWTWTFSENVSKKVHFPVSTDFVTLSSEDKRNACSWDDVTAMYRRSVLLEIPFRPVMFSEDSIWAHDALAKGKALVYEANAGVYHYHHQSFAFRFKRMLTIFYHDTLFWGSMRRPRPWWRTFGQFTYHLLRHRQLVWGEKARWLIYNLNLLLSEWGAYSCCRLAEAIGGKRLTEAVHRFFCKTSPIAGT